MSVSHEEQQRIWDEEHAHPRVLQQMDSSDASSGVERFWEFLQAENAPREKGIELGCGKGRNVIWLSGHGVEMQGIDFSPHAIEEAKRRAGEKSSASFKVRDATTRWPFKDGEFDFSVDCFATTDIESPEGRAFAVHEMYRVLRKGGYALAYLLSPEDEFHKAMIEHSPAAERNAFVHDSGKFEKTFDEAEIRELYGDFTVVRLERVMKTTEFFGKTYACKHFWTIFRK